ncbi:cellulose synthase subunit BcsC-related outer membrane protein [Hyphomonas sp.]|uniref:cellulose synthase subunit BcsC-related outer membrane protein n=1 Tax=Hyphomonas sp. TaxID=87 RepID=UPI0025C51DE4|nr:cellulose synthase subunit BcsC-related outer membrane protein [Hyphomonas sp.]
MRLAARLLRTALVSACVALAAAWPTAAAQAARAGQAEGVFAIGIPQAATPGEIAAADTILEPAPALVQAVWNLGAAGDWDAAQKVLRALQSANPSWKAPANLKSYLAAGQRDQQIREALAVRDWSTTLALLPAPTPSACGAPFHLWARADALEGLGGQADINAFYVRALTYCTAPDLTAALAGRALSVLDTDGLAAAAALPSLSQSNDTRVRLAHTRLVRAERWQRFEAAVATGNLSAAQALAARSDDPRLLTQAGWTFLEADALRATTYFERAHGLGGDGDALRGLVMATLATGKVASARAAAAQATDAVLAADLEARVDLGEADLRRQANDWAGAVTLAANAARANPDLAEPAEAIIAGARLEAAADAYEQGAFAESRRFALEAAEHPPSRRAALMRAAWSDLQLSHSRDAASAFSRLYLELPDAESAEGYALAARRTGDLDTAAALARTLGGPLAAKVEAQYAAAAFDQGDYLIARAHAPETYEALGGLDGNWYRQAVSARRQGGTAGENRLTGFVSTTSAGTTRGADRFEAGLSVYRLDAGAGARRETFAAPYAAWSREGTTSLAARLGLLPVGADADAAINAELSVARDVRGGVVEARAFVRPKTESVLAMAGRKDGAGNDYGRVTETGARLSARLPAGKAHTVQADLSAASLDGVNTAGNSMFGAGLSASRTFDKDGFAYLVTGPFYQYQSYDRNTNFFTPAQGGYFSPQAFHRAGWSLNAQTDPLKDWIARANLAVAHESVEEDAAPANPLLAAPQPLIGGGDSSGLAGALDISVALRVSRNAIISANAAAIVSQAYEDVRIGFALTWAPGGRTGLVRGDLPTDPFNPGAWIQP